MGIPGLYAFIKRHPDLLVPHKLCNSSVVINGNGLIHQLFYSHKCNFKFDVNYRDFEKVCVNFLRALQMCKVKAYIVFDGALHDEKITNNLEHNQRRIEAYSTIICGEKRQLLSGFAYSVFTNVAQKLRVPFCCCDFEADREIALLANALDCPVFGDDGDFFIFDIKAGYIPWQTFELKHLREKSSTMVTGEEFLTCNIFHREKFCEKFTIAMPLLPLMACLLGNDRISEEDALNIHSRLHEPQCREPQSNITDKPKHTKQQSRLQRFRDVIEWISKYDSTDTALRDVKKIFETGNVIAMKKIEDALQEYQLNDSETEFKYYLDEIETCRKYEEVKPPKLDLLTSLPDWFVVLFRLGDLQPKFINVILQRRYFTHLFVEDNRKPSCNRSSLRIRQAIFGILLKKDDACAQREFDTVGSEEEQQESNKDSSKQCRRFDDETLCKSQQKRSVVQYDRLDANETVTPTHIAPLEQLETYGPLPDLWCIPKLSMTNRRSLLFEVLGLDLASVTALPPDYQLPIAVAVHCMKNSNPQVSIEQLLAMLLCFVRGYVCDSFQSENASSVLAKVEETEFQSNPPDCHPYNQTADEAGARSESDGRQKSFLGTNQEMKIDSEMSSPCVTKDRLHGESACAGKLHFCADPSVKFGRISERHLSLVQTCAQWQSCMQYATYLNSILRDPFPKPDVTKLYHGTEIATLYYALIKLDLRKQTEWIRRYLQMVLKSKRAAEMFDQIYEVVKVCCKEVEPQLPVLGCFSEILPEDYVEIAANVFKQKGYSVPTYGHIYETDERVICFNCGELDHKSPACRRPKNQCSLCEKWGHNSKFCATIKTFNWHFNSIPMSQPQPTKKIMPKAVGPDASIEIISSGCVGIDPMLVEGFSGLSLEKWLENDTNVSKQGPNNLRDKGYMNIKGRRIICFNCGAFDHKSPVCHRPKNKCSLCEKLGHDSKFCYTKRKTLCV